MSTIVSLLVYLLLSLPLVGAYAMLAIGIVVIFRASRVLNLAHGAMAMLPAYLVYEMARRGVPMVAAVPLGVLAGALFGAAVERLFIRPLARQGPTAQTVGTIAVYGLVVAAAAQVWGSGSHVAPTVFPDGGFLVKGTLFRWGQLGLFLCSLACAGAFLALFRFTRVGLAMRGSAENPRAAALMGVNPHRMARLAWMLGGGLAGLAGILLASVTNLQPYTLSLQMLPAFVAALIGGLGSMPGAVLGSFAVGAAQGMVPAFALFPALDGVASQVGMPQLVLTVIALVAMYLRGGRFSAGEARSALATANESRFRHSTFDPALAQARGGSRRWLRFALLAALVAWPFLGVPGFLKPLNTFSLEGDAILACEYFMVAASIVMLTGWVGQISLSQAAFVGISAFGSALITRNLGITFPGTLLLGAALAGLASAILGVVALRVRGLYLAVATLIFAWMADQYLFVVPWFAGVGGSATASAPTVGLHGAFPFFDFTDRRTFYLVMLAMAATILFGLHNVRDSKTGRAWFAVRGSEIAAGSMGIDVMRYKLLAFGAAGFIAGLAGNLMLAHQVTVVPDQFSLATSLLFLSIAVVGGLRSLNGAIAASLIFAGLGEVFFRIPALGEYLQLVSAMLLAVILLVYPGGLAALPATARRVWARGGAPLRRLGIGAALVAVGRRAGLAASAVAVAATRAREALAELPRRARLSAPAQPPLTALAVASASLRVVGGQGDAGGGGAPAPAPAPERVFADRPIAQGTVLEAENVTVRFGGLVAVDSASVRVDAGQIVGLIGPNGAGKTTLFNAISGLNVPTAGTVRILGRDATQLPAHRRAALGLGRTFQLIQLFPELTVFENLLVATHLQNRTGFLAHLGVTARALRGELAAEETCRRVVRFLQLEEYADRHVAGLPFGTLRMIEIARALATGAPILMLDEPASGLDNKETDRFADLLRFIRDRLGISILLIEHDVRMVAAVCDYLYVIDRGRPLADGRPDDIRRNPEVIAAYLGEAPVEEMAG